MTETVLTSDSLSELRSSAIARLSLYREAAFVSAGVITAFLLRLFLVPTDSVINGDGIYYVTLGQKIISGDLLHGISAYWSPLYSVLCGLASVVFADREFAGRFVSVVAGSVLVVPVYYLARDFYGRIPASIGVILLVLHPLLIRASGWVMTESLYSVIFISAILIFWYAVNDGRYLMFALTGILFGAAFLVKPEAIGFLGLVPIVMLAAQLFRGRKEFQKLVLGYLILMSGFAFLFLPYVVFLHSKTGQWTISQKIAVNLPAIDYEGELLKLTPSGEMTMKDRIWGDDYETRYSGGPTVQPAASASYDLKKLVSDVTILGTKALTLLKKQLRDYFPAILPYFFMILAMIGLFRKSWTRDRTAKELFLFSFLFCTLLGYAASSVELRYLVPVIPILLAWTANGIVEFGEWLAESTASLFKSRPLKPLMSYSIVLALALVSLAPLFLANLQPDTVENIPMEEKLAGIWIREHSDRPTPLVMASNNTVAFYAEANHIYLPDEELATVVDYARRRNVDYIVVSERRIAFTPELSVKFPTMHEDLELVYQDTSRPGMKVYIYKPKSMNEAQTAGVNDKRS